MDFILVLFAVPLLAWGISLILDRALPARANCPAVVLVPPLIGIFAVLAAYTLAGSTGTGPAGPAVIAALFSLIAVILAAAIATPAPLLDRPFPKKPRTVILFSAAALTIPFLLALLVNPEYHAGGPFPLVADRLPLLGGIFDLIMDAVPLAAAFGFEPVFSAFLYAGIYLEIVLVTAILFLLVRLFADRIPKEQDGTGPGG